MPSLWPHQIEGLKAFFEDDKRLVAYDVGLGKTRIATTAYLIMQKKRPSARALALAPISAHGSWYDEMKLSGLTEGNIRVMSYETFLKWDADFSLYDFIVFDEIHKLKNPQAKRTKKAMKVFANTPYKMGLTGTAIDRYHEIYSQIKTLDLEYWERYGIKNYTQFLNTFFHCHPNFHYPISISKQNIAKIMAMIHPITITAVRDLTDMPQTFYIDEKFKMDLPTMRELVDIGDFSKTLMRAGGFEPTLNGRLLKDPRKAEWVKNKLEETTRKAVIFCRFVHEAKYLARELDAYCITGDDKKDLDAALHQGGKHVVATYCLKEGANLQYNYSIVIFYSLPLSGRDWYQSKGRVDRPGQDEKVVVYNLLGGWIDEQILVLLKAKKDAREFFMQRFKGTGNNHAEDDEPLCAPDSGV
jgi:superfamily II DNA or RNA helicase